MFSTNQVDIVSRNEIIFAILKLLSSPSVLQWSQVYCLEVILTEIQTLEIIEILKW